MALQSTGAISFSDIVAEFGGVDSHSLSEYHALSGLGVSGIPASGEISLSDFHGKSNQVTTSVWVVSGYNSTSWEYWKTVYDGGANRWVVGVNLGNSWVYVSSATGLGASRVNDAQAEIGGTHTTITFNGYQLRRGSLRYTSGSGAYKWYNIDIDESVTTWVDTSSYQDQTVTVQITT